MKPFPVSELLDVQMPQHASPKAILAKTTGEAWHCCLLPIVLPPFIFLSCHLKLRYVSKRRRPMAPAIFMFMSLRTHVTFAEHRRSKSPSSPNEGRGWTCLQTWRCRKPRSGRFNSSGRGAVGKYMYSYLQDYGTHNRHRSTVIRYSAASGNFVASAS